MEPKDRQPSKRTLTFKGSVEALADGRNVEAAVAVLHQELDEVLQQTPALAKRRFGPEGWSLYDNKSNQAEGNDPSGLLADFKKHDLEPDELLLMHQNWTGQDDERYDISCQYKLGERIRFTVSGPDRLIVDGLETAFQRIVGHVVSAAQQPIAGAEPSATHSGDTSGSRQPEVEHSAGWLKRTWREHTMTALIALSTAVAAAGIATYLNWN